VVFATLQRTIDVVSGSWIGVMSHNITFATLTPEYLSRLFLTLLHFSVLFSLTLC